MKREPEAKPKMQQIRATDNHMIFIRIRFVISTLTGVHLRKQSQFAHTPSLSQKKQEVPSVEFRPVN